MSKKRALTIVLTASAAMLAVGIGSQFTGAARALPPGQTGMTIPYSGSLADEAGQPVADGAYAFTFALYATENGGEPLWAETQEGVMVQNGAFTALLGSTAALPKEALSSGARWLEVAVRGPGEAEFTALAPRQELGVGDSVAAASPSAGPACAHDHLGEAWPSTGVYSDSNYALVIENVGTGDGIRIYSHATAPSYAAFYGENAGAGTGVWARSTAGRGVYGESGSGPGIYAWSGGCGNGNAALRANSTNTGCGIAAYLNNRSGYPTAEFDQVGSGRVLDLQNAGDAGGTGGGDFIAGFSKDADFDLQFRITSSGEGRSDVGWTTPAEDFAEMLPAVEGLEPGDVLVIGPDGKLARSSEPYQASVAGVYSTQPGFVGGQPVEGEVEGAIPLAVVGVVPVKVTAENGPIHPGDLLVASSIPGHAMKAGPNPPQGTVIGKALEPLDEGSGVIQMLATLQ